MQRINSWSATFVNTLPSNARAKSLAQLRAGYYIAAFHSRYQPALTGGMAVRIGLSYFVIGPAKRTVDMRMIEDQFGRGAVICPALTELEPEDRKCAGCRRCWAAHIDSPIICPKI